MVKEKVRFWLVILVLFGLVGASNTGLIDSVENAELHQEEVVLYNQEVNEWDVDIQIDEMCYYYCYIEIDSIQILVDGAVVVDYAGMSAPRAWSLNGTQRCPEVTKPRRSKGNPNGTKVHQMAAKIASLASQSSSSCHFYASKERCCFKKVS